MSPGGGQGPEVDGTERGFQSFSEAARAVLGLLARRLPGSAVFVGHLDRDDGVLRVVDSRANDSSIPIEPGQAVPLDASLCFHMVSGRGPALVGDAAADPVYGPLAARRALDVGSYVAAPLALADGTRIGSLCAVTRRLGAFDEHDLDMLSIMARMLAFQLGQARREEDFERISESLRTQAATDPLTGIPNRRAFMSALEREWQLTRRGTASSYLVVADVDGLKAANDTFGHSTGDALLKDVGHALSSAARGTDIVGRLGGDEFGVLLVGCEGEREADGYCRRASALLERNMDGRTAQARVSLGFRGLADSSSAAQALHLADQAMYARKAERAAP